MFGGCVFNAPAEGHIPWAQKKLQCWVYLAEKTFDDILSLFDTVHESDRRTDRRTPADGKYRACAWRRAVIN